MSEVIIDATDASFESDVLASDMPVLVDFWAPWCGPCIALGPVLEGYAKAYAGKVKFVKLNVDENDATREAYGVRGLPLLLLFQNGEIQKRLASNTARGLSSILEEVAGPANVPAPVTSTTTTAIGAAVPAFGADPGRKTICLGRLQQAAGGTDVPPSQRMTREGDGSRADLPAEMLKLIDELWDVARKTRNSRIADETAIAVVEAIDVGADLNPLLQKVALWLLYDPGMGVSSYLPDGRYAELFQRLAVLHRAEAEGKEVASSEFEKLRKDALALVELGEAGGPASLPPGERFAWNMAMRLERTLAQPLAEVGASWAFVTMLIADIVREEPHFLLDSELERRGVLEEETRLKVESQLGRRPTSNAAAQSDWADRYKVLRDQLEQQSRQAEPALFKRFDAWNARQVEMAAELTARVADYVVTQLRLAGTQRRSAA